MAHSLSPPAARPISTFSKKTIPNLSSPAILKVRARSTGSDNGLIEQHVERRSVVLGIAGLFLGLNVGDNWSAKAASRRPPPPPPTEKKDPNMSGVMAKVLASKKRKEAMKESMEKLREKGKTIEEPSQ